MATGNGVPITELQTARHCLFCVCKKKLVFRQPEHIKKSAIISSEYPFQAA